MMEILAALAPDYISGLTLLGGEPLEPENQKGLLPLVKMVKERFPNKSIWCYTGYLFDSNILEIDCLQEQSVKCNVTDELLSYFDVLVDGKFMIEQKDITLKFRGSRNQRIINVPKTLINNKI